MKLQLTSVLENGELLERDGLLYKPNSTEPLTAKVEQFDENGQLMIRYTAIDGKKEGLFQGWYDNGQLKQECTYVDGKLDGVKQNWYRDVSLTLRSRMLMARMKAWLRLAVLYPG
ncbi:MAG TPA: hypothetical protein DCS89_05550 [Gammaproteobacteria bacterium]|jgi:antitoxin component YwqK of YwqJK toxin-antitoxin module|nr:hypothetical protein [Gammaproteobacteria bacterium]|tara:strand:+ start:170 stop:514 length:345 start_codon:yes stop_codon:yes gene_type:complete